MSRQKKSESLDSDSRRQCVHFHEKTETRDEQAWGECWIDPSEMIFQEGDDGEPVMAPSVRWLYLPYVCGKKQQRLQ